MKNNQQHRVVITGTGMITPLGHNVTETWEAILAGKSGIKVAEGFFHGFSGWAIFLFAFVLLLFINVILNFSFRDNYRSSMKPTALSDSTNGLPLKTINWLAFSIVFTILIYSGSIILKVATADTDFTAQKIRDLNRL